MSDVMEPEVTAVGDLEPTPDPPQPSAPAPEPVTMTLVDHLSELRRRVAISIVAVLVFSAVGFFFAEQIIVLLLTPLPNGEVVFLTLSGGFMVYLRIAIIVGILLAMPVILYQLWAFVAPGLMPHERRSALP
jgi:sec-independent protein translocase protein TatC